MGKGFTGLTLALALAACASVSRVELPAPTPGAPFAAEIERFRALDGEAAPARCQVLFVGSSSIRMWSTLAQDMHPYPVINRGFGGSTIADVNLYFDTVVAPYRPRAIVFYAGENDIENGATPAQVAASFEAFMRRKRAELGATPVYFIALKPSLARQGRLPQQSEANRLIRRMADRARDLVFIDVAPGMMQDGAPRDIFTDRLHMNVEGYAHWTRLVRAALDAPAPTRAPGCGEG
jgi:lysophospholipase L1-like esterase